MCILTSVNRLEEAPAQYELTKVLNALLGLTWEHPNSFLLHSILTNPADNSPIKVFSSLGLTSLVRVRFGTFSFPFFPMKSLRSYYRQVLPPEKPWAYRDGKTGFSRRVETIRNT